MSEPRAEPVARDDDALLRLISRHGKSTRHFPDDTDLRYCNCWHDAIAVLDALRKLPIKKRMEAMDMECVGHMDGKGQVWMGKGDADRLTVFADSEASEEFVRG